MIRNINKLSFILSKMPQIPTQIWVLQEMQLHCLSGFCCFKSCRMTLGHEAIFSLKEWKYTLLMLLKEYYLPRFSYETGIAKKRTREERKFSSP